MTKKDFKTRHHLQILRQVVELAQTIDRCWGDADFAPKARDLRDLLSRCAEHPHPSVTALARHARLIDPAMSQQHFLGILVPIERAYTRGVADHDFLALEGDSQQARQPISGSYVVADCIRSAFNIGAVFRTCECFGIDKLFLAGYSATPDDAKVRKTSMQTSDVLPWQQQSSQDIILADFSHQQIPNIAVEKTPQSISLYNYKFPPSFALWLGNERHGLSPSVVSHCQQAIHIPQWGVKNSLNVAIALAVVLGEWQRQRLVE